MTAEFYNSLGRLHGTIMIFLGIVPVAFAAFGTSCRSAPDRAPDMTFPKINMASFWAFFVGGSHAGELFRPGRRGQGGWTSYTPLADIADKGRRIDDF
jgi:cytochrome c oxidase subunit 1